MEKKGKSTATPASPEARTSESQANSAMEITMKRQIRTAYRRFIERLTEKATEILQLIQENLSSVSEQRTAILHHRTTEKEKVEILQGPNEDVLELCTEEDIMEEIEAAGLF